MNATAKTSAFEIMKKKRGYHEKVIQKRMDHMDISSQNQEPISEPGNQLDVDDEDIQVNK